MNSNKYIMKYSSPKSNRRGCICKNGKVSRKCCTGELHAQGIGPISPEN